MLKQAFALSLLLLCQVASAESKLDESLKDLGVINDDYVYTDMETAEAFFTMISKVFEMHLSEQDDDRFLMESAFMTPYYGEMNARVIEPIDDFERAVMTDVFQEKSFETADEFCDDLYRENLFMIANDYTFRINFLDNYSNHMASILLNNETCQ